MLLLLVICILLVSLASCISVAPGDIDEKCFNKSGRQPVPDNTIILLDTQDYRELTLLDIMHNRIWKSINFDGLETPGSVQQVS